MDSNPHPGRAYGSHKGCRLESPPSSAIFTLLVYQENFISRYYATAASVTISNCPPENPQSAVDSSYTNLVWMAGKRPGTCPGVPESWFGDSCPVWNPASPHLYNTRGSIRQHRLEQMHCDVSQATSWMVAARSLLHRPSSLHRIQLPFRALFCFWSCPCLQSAPSVPCVWHSVLDQEGLRPKICKLISHAGPNCRSQ